MSFSHLKKLDVRDRTSLCDLPELGPKARLILKPSTDANPPYYNDMLKLSGKRARKMARSDGLDPDTLAQNREDDRALFPIHVIVGWECVPDEDGVEVPYSREKCVELLEALRVANDVFDRVRNHSASLDRFREDYEESAPDGVELAGNSESGSASS